MSRFKDQIVNDTKKREEEFKAEMIKRLEDRRDIVFEHDPNVGIYGNRDLAGAYQQVIEDLE